MTKSIIMIGASGAVGSHALNRLIGMDDVSKITLLVRRKINIQSDKVTQHIVDVLDPSTYDRFLSGHTIAISTFGVGEPSKMAKDDFVKIDKDAVLEFSTRCKAKGVSHFQSLGSVGIDANLSQYYLKTKGELENGLRDLGFDRLSLFHPSMILTPTNRYGFSQGLTLAVWPYLTPFLLGPLRKLRGIKVDRLGTAIANNLSVNTIGEEILEWDEFEALN